MKKFGFTLAELIITLSIVGVVAALAAPAITNLVPDKNKVKVINYHNTLENAIANIMNDESIFHPYTIPDSNNNYVFTNDGNTYCTGGVDCIGAATFLSELNNRMGLDNGLHSDGSSWFLSQNPTGNYSVVINTNGMMSQAYPSASKPSKATSFIFGIEESGSVTAKDPLTDAYLRNPLNMNDRKTDYAWAKANKDKKY